jgi:eukaryotic-like serine/threonine-protein kinase
MYLAHALSSPSCARGPFVGESLAGPYDLVSEIGRGAGGVVFTARHRATGREVAVKAISRDAPLGLREELRAQFVREARVLHSLRHPGIVKILGEGTANDGSPYILLEKVEGCTLEDLIASRSRLPHEAVIAIALQVCDALDAVHEAGLVHCDVKPSNILVSGGARLTTKLIDFGTVRLPKKDRAEITSQRAPTGTPAYMSPEQFLDFDEVDRRADLYALGATLFECLAGKVPYPGSLPQVVLAVCGAAPVPSLPDDVPPALGDAVRRALARDRKDRYSTAADMAEAVAGSVALDASAAVRPARPSTR